MGPNVVGSRCSTITEADWDVGKFSRRNLGRLLHRPSTEPPGSVGYLPSRPKWSLAATSASRSVWCEVDARLAVGFRHCRLTLRDSCEEAAAVLLGKLRYLNARH
jgi:hypothetical protein